jgi:hypothetical protein
MFPPPRMCLPCGLVKILEETAASIFSQSSILKMEGAYSSEIFILDTTSHARRQQIFLLIAVRT